MAVVYGREQMEPYTLPAVGICEDQHVGAIAYPGYLQRLCQKAIQDAVGCPGHERIIRYPAPAGLRLQCLPHLCSTAKYLPISQSSSETTGMRPLFVLVKAIRTHTPHPCAACVCSPPRAEQQGWPGEEGQPHPRHGGQP